MDEEHKPIAAPLAVAASRSCVTSPLLYVYYCRVLFPIFFAISLLDGANPSGEDAP